MFVKSTLALAIAMSAAAVIGVGNAGAAAATAAPTAAVVTAPASGALPDIVGLRPAIPAQQAYDFLKAYDRAARVYVSDTPLGALGAPPISPKAFPYELALAQDPISGVISVSLTLPPSKALVWRITRYTVFPAGQEPTAEKVIESLRAKYGPEAVLIGSDQAPAQSALAWYFDETGKRVERPGGLDPRNCSWQHGPTNLSSGALGDVHGLAYLLMQPLDDRPGITECRAVIVVSAQMELPPGTANFRVVGRLRVTVADLPLEARAHAATLALIAKGSAAEAEQEKQREDKVAAPKL